LLCLGQKDVIFVKKTPNRVFGPPKSSFGTTFGPLLVHFWSPLLRAPGPDPLDPLQSTSTYGPFWPKPEPGPQNRPKPDPKWAQKHPKRRLFDLFLNTFLTKSEPQQRLNDQKGSQKRLKTLTPPKPGVQNQTKCG